MKKTLKFKAIVFSLILAISFSFGAPVAKAGIWGESLLGNFGSEALAGIWEYIDDVIKAIARQAVINIVVDQINNSLTGGEGGVLFITDWEDTISDAPLEAAKASMNDFFSDSARGMCSSSSSGNDYSDYICTIAKNATIDYEFPEPSFTEYLEDSSSDPEEMFEQGNMQAFNAYISNPANNPFGYSLMAEEKFSGEIQKEESIAETKAIAYQGFKGSESDGSVITPGSVIQGVTVKGQTVSIDTIANTDDWVEVLTSALIRTVANSISDGIGDVQETINRETANTTD